MPNACCQQVSHVRREMVSWRVGRGPGWLLPRCMGDSNALLLCVCTVVLNQYEDSKGQVMDLQEMEETVTLAWDDVMQLLVPCARQCWHTHA